MQALLSKVDIAAVPAIYESRAAEMRETLEADMITGEERKYCWTSAAKMQQRHLRMWDTVTRLEKHWRVSWLAI